MFEFPPKDACINSDWLPGCMPFVGEIFRVPVDRRRPSLARSRAVGRWRRAARALSSTTPLSVGFRPSRVKIYISKFSFSTDHNLGTVTQPVRNPELRQLPGAACLI